MITHLTEKECCNLTCKQKLKNGYNIGGWKAHRTKERNWQTGYTCRRCSTGSTIGTNKLALYQQTHHYGTEEKEPEWKKTKRHEKKWNRLLLDIKRLDEKEATQNDTKFPTWKQVLERTEKKLKEAKE